MSSKSLKSLALALALPVVGLGILATLYDKATEAQTLPTGSAPISEPPPRVMNVSPRSRQPQPTTFEEIQRERENFLRSNEIIPIPLKGIETKGKSIRAGGIDVQLPPDAYIEYFISDHLCAVNRFCPEAPVYVIRRGNSRISVSAPSGVFFAEKISTGEEKAFDFIRQVLPKVNIEPVTPTPTK